MKELDQSAQDTNGAGAPDQLIFKVKKVIKKNKDKTKKKDKPTITNSDNLVSVDGQIAQATTMQE